MGLSQTTNNTLYPIISIESPVTNAHANLNITGSIDYIKIDSNGKGYTSDPNITISDDSNIIRGTKTIQVSRIDGEIRDITFSSGGSGYSSIPSVSIEKSSSTDNIVIPFKNSRIYRNLAQDLKSYDNAYYLEYQGLGNTSDTAERFTITKHDGTTTDYITGINIVNNNILYDNHKCQKYTRTNNNR